MSKIFLTGGSGYIGGQVLQELASTRPDFHITVLVRDPEKAGLIRSSFPHIKTVIGDLDDSNLMEHQASQASIILNLASTNHISSVHAIHKGLKMKRDVADSYWIQISGASALAVDELAAPNFVPGSSSSRIFDDASGLAAMKAMIKAYPSRAVDNYMFGVAAEKMIKTAIVFPPIIYGVGQGPVNHRSIQIPSLAQATLQRGRGLRVGQGLNRWGNIHIGDMGRIFSSLALKADSRDNNEATWGDEGLYLAGVGELTFGDVSRRIAEYAHSSRLISSSEVDELDKATSDKILPHGSVLFGTNARSNASKARDFLGWEPREHSLEEEIPNTVMEESRKATS
ncbi:hypothetical protein CDD81_7970 [Ophiocordyceps australis]|uniref:NAD(P)-binding domain-containing protein n=1 Tax=Ophiocordyceps australis TaxID=1399860 RepID=A0A2C5Y2B7_9HYPO|nr:hypothetical protein CDD81_7970 [Ophiocordyceps australis]